MTDQHLYEVAPGGRVVRPTTRGFLGGQSLTRITKDADGQASEESVLPVAFVPMV